MTASRPSRASFAATASTAGKTASAWLVNLAMMPAGEGSPESSHAVCETFASTGERERRVAGLPAGSQCV